MYRVVSGKTNYTEVNEIVGSDAHSDLFKSTVRSLSSYTHDEIRLRLAKYFKFIVVRNPLTR